MNDNEVTYIIGHRDAMPDRSRTRNLFSVLAYLKKNFKFHVVVIEQDKAETSIVKDKVNELGMTYVFAKNNGFFNRSWTFNIGVKHFPNKYYVCADNDVVMVPNEMREAIVALTSYDAVSPNAFLVDMSDPCTVNFIKTGSVDLKMPHYVRGGINFSSTLVMFTHQGYQKICGWDENFRGWGGEDDVQTLKIKKFLTYKEFNYNAYHLYHTRNQATGDGAAYHSLYQNNVDIINKVIKFNDTELIDYMNKISNGGDLHKYENDV
jgi:hypothetical protein